MSPLPVSPYRTVFLLLLTACGGTTFHAGISEGEGDASLSDATAFDSGNEDSTVRQGGTDGGGDGALTLVDAGAEAGLDAFIDADAANPDAAPLPPPTTCAAANNAIGCCYGNVSYTCNNGSLAITDCTPIVCGWGIWSNGAGYECVNGADAAAFPGPPQYPRDCQ